MIDSGVISIKPSFVWIQGSQQALGDGRSANRRSLMVSCPSESREVDPMSNKREMIAKILPKGFPFAETLNNNAAFVALRRNRFSDCPEFAERIDLYRHIAAITEGPIDYLEFGVWKGEATDAWRKLNTHPDSRFVGFDTFEGLPEDWEADHPKGTFSTGGAVPRIDDDRVSFVKGLFQDTLREYLVTTPFRNRLVVNVDCDLYSATLFVLGTLDKFFEGGTVIIFDDFYSMNHETKAFIDYDKSFGRTWKALGRMPHCVKVAIEIVS
jgi:O-methyltransferase